MDMVAFIAFIDVVIAPTVPETIYYYCFFFLSSPETQIWISK